MWASLQVVTQYAILYEQNSPKISTRLKARNKWALQSSHNKIINAKQGNLYKSKKIMRANYRVVLLAKTMITSVVCWL